MTDVIAIIPARGGSKGVPGKNIVPLLDHPLIAFSIVAAHHATSVERTIVSTDSAEIAEIALAYGAEVPFIRPAELATDSATDRGFLAHAMDWLREHEGITPEYFVHLRPTTPLRDPDVIDDAVRLIQNTPEATSLRSAHLASKTPYKWFELDDDGYFKGIRPDDPRPEYYNLPRQSFPPVYDPNGYVDVVRASQVLNSESIHGTNMLGYVTPFSHEVDTLDDIAFLEYLADKYGSPLLPFLDSAKADAAEAGKFK